jgi:phage baseplate assembly protein W|tara:strand:+ start:17 stop:433 length:417 start_codon:yes stop_codon:yes gene_type:complete
MSAIETDLNPNKTVGLKLPLGRDKFHDFALTKTSLEQAEFNLKNLLQTYIGERPMQPTFGSKLLELCFEQQNDELPENIEKEVRRAVSEWLDYINIQNVETLTEEGDLNQIYVKIDYSTTLNPNTINQITIDASTGGY